VLIDAEHFQTVAAGMIVDRRVSATDSQDISARSAIAPSSEFIFPISSKIKRAQREGRFGGRAGTFWLTGLSASGKSTIARELEASLFDEGSAVFLIDGDNLRSGLCSDLNFSESDRQENIRRAAHTARIMNEAGVSVICCFISPLQRDRDLARTIIGDRYFSELYIKASLESCEARDPKGLYVKARRGEIPDFTGINSPYEAPENPDLVLDTESFSVQDLADQAKHFFGQFREKVEKFGEDGG
jgi:adenylyl-sulfate kinase